MAQNTKKMSHKMYNDDPKINFFNYICIMGYSYRYDTYYDDETGEWLEKIGFCEEEDNCLFCKAYNEDGRPATAFDAPKEALED